MDSDSTELRRRIDKLLAKRRPSLAKKLRPGATAATLARFAEQIGCRLPPDFDVLYRWHDGTTDQHTGFEGFYGWSRLDQIVENKAALDELERDGVFASSGWAPGSWWNAGWIPFLQFNLSDYVCVDATGSLGQGEGAVFLRYNELDERVVLAPSIDAWLRAHLALLEAGPEKDDRDRWTDHFESDLATEIRGRVSPGFPTKAIAARRGS